MIEDVALRRAWERFHARERGAIERAEKRGTSSELRACILATVIRDGVDRDMAERITDEIIAIIAERWSTNTVKLVDELAKSIEKDARGAA